MSRLTAEGFSVALDLAQEGDPRVAIQWASDALGELAIQEAVVVRHGSFVTFNVSGLHFMVSNGAEDDLQLRIQVRPTDHPIPGRVHAHRADADGPWCAYRTREPGETSTEALDRVTCAACLRAVGRAMVRTLALLDDWDASARRWPNDYRPPAGPPADLRQALDD